MVKVNKKKVINKNGTFKNGTLNNKLNKVDNKKLDLAYGFEAKSSTKVQEEKNDYNKKLIENGMNNICRVIVLDWLIGVHRKFQFRPATIHIGITLFDRFIRLNDKNGLINCDNLQLVGATCLHIASKYEDMNPAVLLDYCIMSNSEFNPKDMINMEVEILNTLQFKIADKATLIDYLDSFFDSGVLKGVNKNRLPKYFYSSALYISELSLLHQAMVLYPPRVLSTSILLLLCLLFEKDESEKSNLSILKDLKYSLKRFSKINSITKEIRMCIKSLIGIIKEQFFLEIKIKEGLENSILKDNPEEGIPFIYLKDLTNKWRNAYTNLYKKITSLRT
ncbi:cyclin [Cryptosporidium ubiquitum]|uniref:Cyclin n=1 Tax=Cryptosporidium ubiquitum TaxID=857276 RepID=A0A1J4MK23_9CRYT|nr:cyclin [Cryptosporidium ubiquitum]OII74367.1 cyclin [Cryptosporidium ubiquitum]